VWSTRRQDSKLIDVCTANSVGFTATKSCINQYKKNPAARLAYLREYANGNPYK